MVVLAAQPLPCSTVSGTVMYGHRQLRLSAVVTTNCLRLRRIKMAMCILPGMVKPVPTLFKFIILSTTAPHGHLRLQFQAAIPEIMLGIAKLLLIPPVILMLLTTLCPRLAPRMFTIFTIQNGMALAGPHQLFFPRQIPSIFTQA